MKHPYDRHHIDIGGPKLKQCRARQKARHKGCGRWKLDNEDNFRKKSGVCRECIRMLDRMQKREKNNRFINITINEVMKISLVRGQKC